MKNKIYLVALVFTFILSCEKNVEINELPCNYNDFKYYNSEIDPLGQMSGDYILIGSDSSISDKMIRDFIKSKDIFNQSYDFKIHSDINYPCYFGYVQKFRERLSPICNRAPLTTDL